MAENLILKFLSSKRGPIANLLALLAFVLVLVGVFVWIRNQSGGGIEVVVPEPVPVLVQASGEVRLPGVYELPRGSRVESVIAAAGGFTDSADISSVNLARILEDGEHLLVAALPTPTAVPTATSIPPRVVGSAIPSASATTQQPADSTALVDLNTANSDDLQTLTRIGPQLADRIIEWREQHGFIERLDELLEVSGIGTATLDGLRDMVVQK